MDLIYEDSPLDFIGVIIISGFLFSSNAIRLGVSRQPDGGARTAIKYSHSRFVNNAHSDRITNINADPNAHLCSANHYANPADPYFTAVGRVKNGGFTRSLP